jgi:hypothetical protein
MFFWWSLQAIKKYRSAHGNADLIEAFDDLVSYIEEDPTRGIPFQDLKIAAGDWEQLAWFALAGRMFPDDAKVVLVNVPPKTNPQGNPVVALAVHVPGSPDPASDHSILWLDAY